MDSPERPHPLLIAPIARFLRRQPPAALAAAGIACALAVGLVDRWLGDGFVIEPFYLAAIFLVGLFGGFVAALCVAFVAAALTVGVRLFEAGPDVSPATFWWNIVVLALVYPITARVGSALRRALDHERELARTDYLTGAANRRAFTEISLNEIRRARRTGRPLSVAYFDIDNFKVVNDHFGHDSGDRLLQHVTGVLRRNVRVVDTISRLGGDEFVVLMPETGHEQARVVIERIQGQMMEVMQQWGWPVTLSIGVMTFNRPPEDVEEILRTSDNLAYAAKRSGKNTICQDAVGEPQVAPASASL